MNKLHKFNYISLLYFVLRSSFLCILTPLFLNLKNQGLLTFLITLCLSILIFSVYVKISHKFQDQNLLEISESCFGKKLGFGINLFYILCLLLYMSLLFLNLTNFIYTEYLNSTNFYVLLFLLFLFVYYFTQKDLSSLCKSVFLFFLLSILLFIIKISGLLPQINSSLLLDNRIHHIEFKEIIKSILFLCVPLFSLLMIPISQVKENEKMKKYQYFIYIFTAFNLFLSLFFIFSILGSHLANAYFYPEFHLLKNIKILGFIEKIESILSIGLIFDMYVSLVLFSFVLKDFTNRYFSKKYFNITYIFLFFFCIFYSISNTTFLVNIITYGFLIYFIFQLVICMKKKKS